MELKLNIYDDNGKVSKTYTRESYRLRLRFLKRFIEVVDLDKLAFLLDDKKSEGNNDETKDSAELIKEIGKMLYGSYDALQEIFQNVFTELTDEEYLDVTVDELAIVLIDLFKYTFNTIKLAGNGSKN